MGSVYLPITGSIYSSKTENSDNNLMSSLIDYVLIDSNRINIVAGLFKQEDKEGKYYSILEAFFKELIDDTVDISDYPTTQIISIIEAHDLLKELLNTLPDSAWFGERTYVNEALESYPTTIKVYGNNPQIRINMMNAIM